MNRRELLRLAPSIAAAAIAGDAIGGMQNMNDAKVPLVEATMLTELMPGDTLVLKCDREISYDVDERLREMLEKKFPGVKALVLSGGLSLEVMRAPK